MKDKSLESKIIESLLYSEIFDHPLSKHELINWIKDDQLEKQLEYLIDQNLIFKKDNFYYLFHSDLKFKNRIEGNKNAAKMLPKALRVGRFIGKFPFVEGVGVSGSLAKGVLLDDSDFDFFIITKPKRLWIARSLLILYKKIFLLNSRKYFCVNYFIDTDHLEIEEKNIFTANEISTLIAVNGQVFDAFFSNNKWVSEYKNYTHNLEKRTVNQPKNWLSKSIEILLKGKFGEFIDKHFMSITIKRWKKKFGAFETDKFDLTMQSRRYISKHHPLDFQNKVLNRFQELKEKYILQHSDTLREKSIHL